jgi:hypothetical protein
MSAHRFRPDALRALQLVEVTSYLRAHGWRQAADLDGKGSAWLLKAESGRDVATATGPG